MAKVREKEERIISLLTEVVSSVCKGQLDYLEEIHIEGLLAVTLDRTKVLLLNLNEGSTKQLKTSQADLKEECTFDTPSKFTISHKSTPLDKLCSTLSKNIEVNESRKRPLKKKIDPILPLPKKVCTETSISEYDNSDNIISENQTDDTTFQCQVVFVDEHSNTSDAGIEYSPSDDTNVSTTEIITAGDESINIGNLKVEMNDESLSESFIQSHQIDHQYVTLSSDVGMVEADEDTHTTNTHEQLSRLAHLLSNSEPFAMKDYKVRVKVDCAVIEGGTSSAQNKPKLLDAWGYHYSLKKDFPKCNHRYWRCTVRNSTKTCYATILENNGFTTGKHMHIHDPPPFDLLHLLITTLKHECRALAKTYPNAPNKAIIQEVLNHNNIDDSLIQMKILACRRLHKCINAERTMKSDDDHILSSNNKNTDAHMSPDLNEIETKCQNDNVITQLCPDDIAIDASQYLDNTATGALQCQDNNTIDRMLCLDDNEDDDE